MNKGYLEKTNPIFSISWSYELFINMAQHWLEQELNSGHSKSTESNPDILNS